MPVFATSLVVMVALLNVWGCKQDRSMPPPATPPPAATLTEPAVTPPVPHEPGSVPLAEGAYPPQPPAPTAGEQQVQEEKK